MKFEFAACTLLVSCLLSGLPLHSANAAEGHGHSQASSRAAHDSSCDLAIQITEEAEQRAGGAHHEVAMMQGGHSGDGQEMAGMAGAHMQHQPPHGGAFFMAPNKLHHLEVLYSDDCGLRIVFYNAFTQPIHADRFRAFVKIIPRSDEEPELLRFATPMEDRSLLHAPVGQDVTKPFDLEIYVAFPSAPDPELFNVRVSDQ